MAKRGLGGPRNKKARTNGKTRPDVYQQVTDTIVEHLEQGTKPWFKPWAATGQAGRPLRHNGVPYRGINTLLLWMEAVEKGYLSQSWMTFKQALDLGANVRKGEKASLVVYANSMQKTVENTEGEEIEESIYFMKGYRVFNADQIDNLPSQFHVEADPDIEPMERLEMADAFFAGTKADIRERGNHAYYHPTHDFIGIPPFEHFDSPEAYASTIAHELCHWTGHKSRLDRDFSSTEAGDDEYAMEELVAELGSCFLAADLKIEAIPHENHSAYIAHWLKVLKQNKRAIFNVASYAEKAVSYLHDLQDANA